MQHSIDLPNHEVFQRAYHFAEQHHAGQLRKSGELYFSHPISVAQDLHTQFNDVALTSAGILHDVVEDCPHVHMSDIYNYFGNEIGLMVDAVTKNIPYFHFEKNIHFRDPHEKILHGGIKDVRVLLLKIADREHNIKTSLCLKKIKQLRLTFESQIFFTPLKNIIQYDKSSVHEAKERLHAYLLEHNIQSSKELYKKLLAKYVDGEDFSFFYELKENASEILWKITNASLFEELMKHEHFSKNIKVLSINSSKSRFEVHFYFQGAVAHDTLKHNLKISSFSTTMI